MRLGVVDFAVFFLCARVVPLTIELNVDRAVRLFEEPPLEKLLVEAVIASLR